MQHSKEFAAETLQGAGVSAGPVNTAPDMVSDAQVIARGFFVNYEAFDTPMPGNPIKMAGLMTDDWTPSAKLGGDKAAVLQDSLGYSVEQVVALEKDGVIANRPPD